MSEGSISKFRRTALKLLNSLADSPQRTNSPSVFQIREHILNPQEQAVYRALVEAGDGLILVFPKTHLVDFLCVRDGTGQISDAVRMDRKRVDFLLCDAATMKPRAVVELFSNDRKEGFKPYQDPFVSRALNSSGLASFRIETRDSYPIKEIRERLIRRLVADPKASEAEIADNDQSSKDLSGCEQP
tara:strand:+ start:292041 stop:292601 length:561 start_codon:yes stop_codon:yes gene_type:complete